MQYFDKIFEFFAPHYCLVCDREGTLLCDGCQPSYFENDISDCISCGIQTEYNKVCLPCRRLVPLRQVWYIDEYDDILEQLITLLKFQRARAAATTLATGLDYILPPLPSATVVSYIPTAPKRVRMRGYDQSALIAREFARMRHLKFSQTLTRCQSARQVGATRQQRFKQVETAFRPRQNIIKDAPHLLIDDVFTTGATLASAAKTLKRAGCKDIFAAVVAKRSLKN